MNSYKICYRDLDGYPLAKNIDAGSEHVALMEFKLWCYRNKVAANEISITTIM